MRFAPLLMLGILVAGFAGCVDNSAVLPDPQGIPSVISPGNFTVPPVPTVDSKVLLAEHAKFVTENPIRKGNSPGHESARVALETLFAGYGLETYRHNFTEGSLEQQNILGIKWGAVRDQWVVVGGHYDTTTTLGADEVLSQGAYDDGSGTMITVHLAKAFSNVSTYYTMVFVGYDGEERGLQGAKAFVNDFHVEGTTPYGNITVVGAIDLDMVGINWPGTQAPMNIMANSEALAAAADAKRIEMGWPNDQWKEKDSLAEAGMVELGSSDYAAFMAASEPAIPTIFFISDFLEMGAPSPAPPQAYTPVGVYPFWHFADTLETMQAMAGGQPQLEQGFQSITEVSAHLLHQLAAQPTLVFDAEPK